MPFHFANRKFILPYGTFSYDDMLALNLTVLSLILVAKASNLNLIKFNTNVYNF